MNTINLRALYDICNDVDYPVWHPFSTTERNCYNLYNMVKGEGIYLYDIHKKKHIDASSGLWNISLGYNNKKIKKYILDQLELLPYCSIFDYTNPTVIKTAKMLLDILPKNMKKVFFTCSGSESIEIAIKAMRQFWNIQGKPEKNIVLSLRDSYHGTYYGSMGISGMEQTQVKEFGTFLGEVKFIDGGICGRCNPDYIKSTCNESCLEEVEKLVRDNAERIAGIVVEPILASKGVEILSDKYIKGIAKICRQYEILLTVDEVALGFYRTGDAFYVQRFDFEPDIICMGKGINSGYVPMGATAFGQRIIDAFSKNKVTMNHGSTQGGNLLACAAAIASMEQYKELNIEDNVKSIGELFKEQTKEALDKHPNVGEIRGKGLLLAIDLVKDKRSYKHLSNQEISSIQDKLRKNGLIVYRSDKGLTILPMLIVNNNQIGNITDVLAELFKKVLFR